MNHGNLYTIQKMIKVIIFAPHSHCVSKERDCDTLAKKAADLLYALLQKIPTLSVEYIKHEISREDADLNRFHSRLEEPRNKLRETILNHYNNPDIERIYLMEMHSFPYNWTDLMRIHAGHAPIADSTNNSPTNNHTPTDLIILNKPENNNAANLLAASVGAAVYTGTDTTDIQSEFTPGRDKIVPYLLEFSEKLTDGKLNAKVEKIANFIAADGAASIHENPSEDIKNLIDEIVIDPSAGPTVAVAIYVMRKYIVVLLLIMVLVIIFYTLSHWQGAAPISNVF